MLWIECFRNGFGTSFIIYYLHNIFWIHSVKSLISLCGINIICSCLALDVINIFIGNINYPNKEDNLAWRYIICKMIFIVIFIIELILTGIFLYRVYSFVSKKSIIYQKIWKKLDNRSKLYNVFRDKVAAISVRYSEQETLAWFRMEDKEEQNNAVYLVTDATIHDNICVRMSFYAGACCVWWCNASGWMHEIICCGKFLKRKKLEEIK